MHWFGVGGEQDPSRNLDPAFHGYEAPPTNTLGSSRVPLKCHNVSTEIYSADNSDMLCKCLDCTYSSCTST